MGKVQKEFSSIVLRTNKILFHSHSTDAGFDLESAEDVVVPAKEFAQKIHTDVYVEIPEGFFGLVKERSGMASKGIFVMGGVIDAGYRGEIMINLGNMSGYDYVIKIGDRIAQIIMIPCTLMMETAPSLSPSIRGKKGFGSTGK